MRAILCFVMASAVSAGVVMAYDGPVSATPVQAAPAQAAPTQAAVTQTAVTQTAVTQTAVTRPALVQTSAMRTYSYGTGSSRKLDVYLPAGAVGKTGRSLPTVVIVHGGGWKSGDKAKPAPQARQFADLGYVAVSINYRLATEAPWPAPRVDTLAALAWLRSHDRSLNINARRMVLLGVSAGGHIAAGAATWGEGANRLKGLVTLSGVLDPRQIVASDVKLRTTVLNLLMRCAPADCPVDYDKAAPKNYLSAGDPQALLFHSRDEIYDPSVSVAFAKRANAVGSGATMRFVEGTKHSLSYWDTVWPTIRHWVRSRIG